MPDLINYTVAIASVLGIYKLNETVESRVQGGFYSSLS